MGFFIDSVNGKRYIGHGGAILGFTSFFAYFPVEEVVMILQNNIYEDQHPDQLPFQELTTIMFQDSRTMETDNSIDRFVGAYYLSTAPNRIITIERKDSGLIAILPDKTRTPLIWLNNLKFQLKGIRNTDGEFVLDGRNVQKIIIRQDGTFEWMKMK